MSKLKFCLYMGAMLCLAALLGLVKEKTGLPISLGDLLFGPGAIIFSYGYLRHEVFQKKKMSDYHVGDPKSLLKRVGIMLAFLMVVVLGIFGVLSGVHEPWVYQSSIKGGMHGYTAILVGLLLLIMGGYGLIMQIVIEFHKPED